MTPRDSVDESYLAFGEALASSCAGRRLSKEMDAAWRNLGDDVTLPLLVQELKRHVQTRTGLVLDISDPALRESARALGEAPAGKACTSVVALMGLIDEWAARATGTSQRREPSERFVRKIDDPARHRPRGMTVDEWLASWFPLLYADARESLDYLTGAGRGPGALRTLGEPLPRGPSSWLLPDPTSACRPRST